MNLLYIDNIIKRKTNPMPTQIWLENGYKTAIAANLSGVVEDLKNSEICYHNIELKRNPFHPQNIIAYKQIVTLLKKEKYDAIHCNSPIGGLLGRIGGKNVKVPKIIYTAHGFHFYKGAPLVNRTVLKWIEMMMARWTDAIITITKEDYIAAQNFKLKKGGKVYYIPGVGIDSSVIMASLSKRNEVLQEIGADKDSILIVSAGEINYNKNNKVIIEALSKLKNNKMHYILCGIGPEKDNLHSLAVKSNISDNVHFLGYRTDVFELLKSSDIFVMPSFREGLSRSMMEAMASGLPCIASKIRGNIDLIEDHKGGYLIDVNNSQGFADAISKLANDKKLRDKIGKSNLETIKTFDINNVKRIMNDIYNEVLF